ncbi:MAG: DUF3575 domain-containing protein [Candidatus Cryptobacteroides sp.]
MDMKGGRLWWEMDEKIFPLLRQATLTVFYSRSSEAFPAEVPADENLEKSKILPLPHSHPAVPPAMPKIGRGSGPVCAIKTNLAYDAASVINLGVEFPLGQKFSIGADIYCPWWRNREKDVTIQIFAADVEGRYWFGNRDRLKPMTGFFAGLYAGAGYFDFQFGKLSNGKGIQSDFFFTGGICAGYAHEICRNLRLEYSVGAGYFLCNFREYTQARETKFGDIKAIGYPWEAKRSSGVLPTKASVSLVWMITSGKGGRK